jgi:hypothetical protein
MLERAVTEMDGHAKGLAGQCVTMDELIAVAIATLQAGIAILEAAGTAQMAAAVLYQHADAMAVKAQRKP